MTESIPPIPDDEFEDPLKNYDPPEYEDPLEAALDLETISTLQRQPYAAISPDDTIGQAAEKMAEIEHACLLVTEGEKLVGLFTDRDLLDHAALEYEQLKNQPVRTVMTKDPVYVFESDSIGAALAVMAVSGYRHVPVLKENKTVSGIVTPRRVTQFLLKYMQPT